MVVLGISLCVYIYIYIYIYIEREREKNHVTDYLGKQRIIRKDDLVIASSFYHGLYTWFACGFSFVG